MKKRYLCVDCGDPTNGARCRSCNIGHIGRTYPHPKAPPGRALELAVLYRGGCTLQEIGEAVGLTRERVRQLIRSVGEPLSERGSRRSGSVAPLAVQVTQQEHRQRLGVAQRHRLVTATTRRARRFAQAVEAVRILHRTLGRSPTMREVVTALGIPARHLAAHGPAFASWLGQGYANGKRLPFRTLTFALYETAGVPPRSVGGAGHVDPKATGAKILAVKRGKPKPRPRGDTCRRGHAEWYVYKSQRQCAACKRAYAAARYAAQKAGVG